METCTLMTMSHINTNDWIQPYHYHESMVNVCTHVFCNGCSPPDPGPDGGCDSVWCQVPSVVVYVFCNCFGTGNNNITMKHFHCVDNLPYMLIWWSWAVLRIARCHKVVFMNLVLMSLVVMLTLDQNIVARCFSATVVIQALDVGRRS